MARYIILKMAKIEGKEYTAIELKDAYSLEGKLWPT